VEEDRITRKLEAKLRGPWSSVAEPITNSLLKRAFVPERPSSPGDDNAAAYSAGRRRDGEPPRMEELVTFGKNPTEPSKKEGA